LVGIWLKVLVTATRLLGPLLRMTEVQLSHFRLESHQDPGMFQWVFLTLYIPVY